MAVVSQLNSFGGFCCFGPGWLLTAVAVYFTGWATIQANATITADIRIANWRQYNTEAYYLSDGAVAYGYQRNFYARSCRKNNGKTTCTSEGWAIAPAFSNASCLLKLANSTCPVEMIISVTGQAEGMRISEPEPCQHGALCVMQDPHGYAPDRGADFTDARIPETCTQMMLTHGLEPLSICRDSRYFNLGDPIAGADASYASAAVFYGIAFAFFGAAFGMVAMCGQE